MLLSCFFQFKLKQVSVCLIAVVMLTASPAISAKEIQLVGTPALSPDGSEIAFSYAGDLWRVSSDGGNAERLTLHPAAEQTPLYSPDGKTIAFVSDRSGSRQVYLQKLDGSAPEQVTFHTEGYLLQDWSNDGQKLLTYGVRDHHWKRGQRLIAVTLGKRQAEELLFDAYAQEGRWSSDGKRVLFAREGTKWWRKGYVGSQASQIWMYDIDTQEFTQLLSDPRGCRSPLWKPDDSGFYYVGAESGTFNLREYDFETNTSQQLTQFEDDSVVQPCISRDGKTIAFRHLFDLHVFKPGQKEPPQKLTITTSGDDAHITELHRKFSTATNVAFSPDGLEIIFAAGGDLWAMDTVLREPVAITQTAVSEDEPVMIEKGAAVLFLKDVDGQVDVYRAQPSDKNLYWWQNKSFEIKRITNDAATETNLQRSPDGEHFAVVKMPGELWLMKIDGTPVRKLVSGFDTPDYDFSPDGKWIVYSHQDASFNDEVWIAPIDGSREPFNISRHPDDDVSPAWSPDGKKIAFRGRRSGDETDIYYVFLRAADEELSSRDRKLKTALDKLNKVRPKKAAPKKTVTPPVKTATTPQQTKQKMPPSPAKPQKATAVKVVTKPPVTTKSTSTLKLPKVVIDFDHLHERLHRISIPNVYERSIFWFKDGKTLAFSASINGSSGTYTVEINTRLAPKKISSSTGGLIQQIGSMNKIGWLSSGKPGTLTDKGASESFSFSVQQSLAVEDWYRAGFDVAWRLMNDNYYDDKFGNRNWSEIRRKYSDAAANAADHKAFAEIVQLMLGELNGSHLGFYPRGTATPTTQAWRDTTAHLGVRFVSDFKGPGLKVRDVILKGPADRDESRILAGETILSIDGTAVDPAMDLTLLLNGRLDRDIELKVQDKDGKDRTVQLRPMSYSLARSRLYPQFEMETHKRVEDLSKGKLGYIHIQGMNMSSFLEFERQLYNVGYGKDGLIIDVRENGGGSTTDHLLTILTQPRHAITVPRGGGRGYPHDRKIYATWSKPIIVLCNQNSFSNAEIFSHAIKTLKRGKVVGVTTAGGVISTGAASVMDLGTLRQPFRGWYLLNGEDMELNGAKPHVELWPAPGELPQGIDRQLEKAVQLLKKDVRKYQRKKQPKLRKATERKVQPALEAIDED